MSGSSPLSRRRFPEQKKKKKKSEKGRGHAKGGEEKRREEAGMFLHELLRQVDAQEKPSPQLLAQVFRALKKSKVREGED